MIHALRIHNVRLPLSYHSRPGTQFKKRFFVYYAFGRT